MFEGSVEELIKIGAEISRIVGFGMIETISYSEDTVI